jgi:proteic killer suppression protein
LIKSFRSKGLEQFFLKGSKAGIQPKHAVRLRQQLTALNVAAKPEDMNVPGWFLHPLKGSEADQWSIWVNGNWRVTFAFDGADVIVIDYRDYH